MAKSAKKAAKKIVVKASRPAKSVPVKVIAKSTSKNAKPAKKPVVVKVAPAAKAPARTVVIAKSKSSNGKSIEKKAKEIIPPPFRLPLPAPIDPNNPNKRVRNQAGLSAKEIAHFRELLVAKRRELIGDVQSMEDEALTGGQGIGNLSNLPDHMADQGTDNFNQEFTLGLMEKDRQLLREIEAALEKIRNGLYGLCEGTGKAIGKPRLEAQPWARFSIEYARKQESGMFRR